jgi:hypothetical protein
MYQIVEQRKLHANEFHPNETLEYLIGAKNSVRQRAQKQKARHFCRARKPTFNHAQS